MTIARTRKLAWLLTPATVGLTWIVAACDTTDHVSGLTRQPALSALIVRSVNVSDLGILAGHSGGSALDVNRSGQAVGFSFDDAEVPAPVLWDVGGALRLDPNVGQAVAINDAGVAVGYVGCVSECIHAMLWGRGAVLKLPPDQYTQAMDVLMDGRVVGKMSEPPSQKKLPALSTAVLWQDGVMGTLDLPVGSYYVYEVHMNDAGQVVATVWNSTEKSVRSFFLGGSGTTDLGSLGGRVTWAHAINAAGQVVGTSLTAEGDPHPFLWESGQMRDLGGLGGSWGHAWGINNSGQIVGESAVKGDLEWHAVAWVEGALSDLGALPSYPNSAARAINDVGQAVGSSYAFALCKPSLVVDGPPPLPGALCYGKARPTLWTIQLANTQSGSNVTVTPIDATTGQPSPVQLSFDDVTGSGETTVTSQAVGQGGGGGPPPPRQFRLGSPPTYYNIETSATFSGAVTVCIHYDGVNFGTENQLKLLHFENAAWVDVTNPGYPDVVNHVICATVTSLSPFLVAQQNFAPIVTGTSLPSNPVALGSVFSMTAAFTDANPSDVHTASIDWQDGVATPGLIAEASGVGTTAGSHSYAAAGVYTIVVTVADGLAAGSRSSALDVPAYVVVYDPSAAFVTGGGWIASPPGACRFAACTDATGGKATFGFVTRYEKGATTPTGKTEFQFTAGGLDFASSAYQWLVVAGARAQFKGQGRLNGVDACGFLLTAIDGALAGGGGVDRFRIKIWELQSGAIVYDNQMSEAEVSDAATALGGGSIVIHK